MNTAEHTTAPSKWAALGVLATGLALIVLDGTIVGVSLPSIIDDLGLDLASAQWVTSLYSVVFAALLLTAGKLGDERGRRRLFVAGLVVFTAGSIFAALSGSAATLVAARLVQGVGGAAILPATLSSVNSLFRGKDRAAAFGVWGAVMAGAAAVGPLAGGLLTEYVGWRWVFWVNIPIALALIALAVRLVPETKGEPSNGRDLPGFALSAAGFGLLVFAIIEGPRLGWTSWPALAAAVGAAAVLALVATERAQLRRGLPVLLDVSLFTHPTFAWGNVTALMVAVGEFALIFVLPLYLINGLGLSTIATGLILAVMTLGAFFSGPSARPPRGGDRPVRHHAARARPRSIRRLAANRRGIPHPTAVVGRGGAGHLRPRTRAGLRAADLPGALRGPGRPVRAGVGQSEQGSATQSTVRQLGSALGAALAGAMLSVGMAASSRGFTGQVAQVADAARASAGASISAMRDAGMPGDVLAPVVGAFADSTRLALVSAVAALAIGLVGAVMVGRSARAGAPADGRGDEVGR